MKYIREGSNTSTPLASVIIPTYNRPGSLREAIQSVLKQEYTCFEIIVINDGGVDVQKLINNMNSKGNIFYFRHEQNKGLAAARNTGLRLARGKYIAYLDDDDIYYPNHLKILVNYLEVNHYKVAYTDAYKAFQKKENGQYVISHRDVPCSYDFDETRILIKNFIPVLCVMHNKTCIDEVGYFNEKLKSHEDWDLWIRMSLKYKFAHINRLTCEYRWREDGTTMTSANREQFIWTIQEIYERYKEHIKLKPKILLERNKYLLNLMEEVYLKQGRIYGQRSEENRTREILDDNYRKVKTEIRKSQILKIISILKEYLNENPYHVQANIDIGKYYLKMGREWDALMHVLKSLSVESQNINAMKYYASICLKLGLMSRAIDIYRNILKEYMNKVKFKLTN